MKLLINIFVCLFCVSNSLNFEVVTNEIFQPGDDVGVIAAFGHFNSDEYTDVITIQHQNSGNKLLLLTGNENRPYFQTSLNCSFSAHVTGVIPGDFNGDSLLDILVSLDGGELQNIKVLWGFNGTIDCTPDNLFSIQNQPLVVDYNGDMIPDIIGQINDERYLWLSSMEKKFTNISLSHISKQKFRKRHSSGLIDLNSDMIPDMIITGEDNIELWYKTGNGFIHNQTDTISYDTPEDGWNGQSTFIDINLDGKVDHVMPVCYDQRCEKSAILIWNSNSSKWEKMFDNFVSPDKNQWGFHCPIGTHLDSAALPITLRSGDVDMDGYPDFIVVLHLKRGPSQNKAVILRNVPCDQCFSKRSLEVIWDVPSLKDIPDVQLVAFFDLFEDGTLDILASAKANGRWKIYALKNTEIFDSCFLKVLVLSGLCYNNCTTAPYGVNQPGPIVQYNMTRQDGTPVVSSSLQLSQSAHFPLQLPYSIFGLGQTPNFIDVLTVSIPATFNESVHKRQWIQIIPNSQIVVIPYPPMEEKRWVKKLFVTPSHLVLLTCIALLATCAFLSLLVGVLHWKERREDKKEKMQDAYRFHFDAM